MMVVHGKGDSRVQVFRSTLSAALLSLLIADLTSADMREIYCACCDGQTGPSRMITSFFAEGRVNHSFLTWSAEGFDPGSTFSAWRSIDGGATFDSCATNVNGQCVSVLYTTEGYYELLDYGVKNNFNYSYIIKDSESGTEWFMTQSFWGELSSKPMPPSPTIPGFSLSHLKTENGLTTATVNIALSGEPMHATLWAHSYAVSFYDDMNATPRVVTTTLKGNGDIVLGRPGTPALSPLRTYHVKVRANGMPSNSAYSSEQHFRVLSPPNLYHATPTAGTSVSMQWSSVAGAAYYEVLYQRLLPEPVVAGSMNAGTNRIWNLPSLDPQSLYLVQVRAYDAWGHPSEASMPVAVETGLALPSDATDVVHRLELHAQPTPFRSGTNVNLYFGLPHAEQVALSIYNLRGQRVRELFSGPRTEGRHTLYWNGRDAAGAPVATGLYVARLLAGSKVLTQKLLVLK